MYPHCDVYRNQGCYIISGLLTVPLVRCLTHKIPHDSPSRLDDYREICYHCRWSVKRCNVYIPMYPHCDVYRNQGCYIISGLLTVPLVRCLTHKIPHDSPSRLDDYREICYHCRWSVKRCNVYIPMYPHCYVYRDQGCYIISGLLSLQTVF